MLLGSACLTGCSATGSSMTAMSTNGSAFAPPAFYEFCERDARLCASSGPQKKVELTPARLAAMRDVNARINARVHQVDDAPSKGDVWRAAGGSGDCEDIAIAKKKSLIALGFPASTLLLTVVQPRFSEAGHTVLTVRTSEGDYVLDSLSPAVRLWNRTPYRFFARQSQEQHGEWERIG